MVRFLHPERLWLLLVGIVILGVLARNQHLRQRLWKALAQTGRPWRDGAGWRSLAWLLVVVALAQPSWGRFGVSQNLAGQDVVLVLDVSRSMAAEDAIPNRVGVAISSATRLLDGLALEPGHRVAVVAFAGRGVVRCPLTFQVGAAKDAVLGLKVGQVEPGGSDLGAALDTAIEAFDLNDRRDGRTVIVMTDGEDLAGTAARGAVRARDAGVVVHGVAIGDPDQAQPIPVGPLGTPLTYQGKPVATRRSDASLDLLARATGGSLIRLGLMPADLSVKLLVEIHKVSPASRRVSQSASRTERFAIFVLAAFVCVLLGSRLVRPAGKMRRVVAGLLFVSLSLGAGRDDARGWTARGETAFRARHYPEALDAFEQAHKQHPALAIPAYNVAASLFQLGRYSEAVIAYRRAQETAGPELRFKVDYALGNALLASGEISSALAAYQACEQSTWPGAAADAIRRDAGLNRAFALRQKSETRPPEDQGDGNDPQKPRPRSSDRPDSDSTDPKKNSGTKAQSNASSPDGSNPDSKAARGKGGQGGSGNAPPRAGSPSDRLDDALRALRKARELRPEDTPTDRQTNTDRRDW